MGTSRRSSPGTSSGPSTRNAVIQGRDAGEGLSPDSVAALLVELCDLLRGEAVELAQNGIISLLGIKLSKPLLGVQKLVLLVRGGTKEGLGTLQLVFRLNQLVFLLKSGVDFGKLRLNPIDFRNILHPVYAPILHRRALQPHI